MTGNPYPTRPGFSARVAFAHNALKLLEAGRDDVYCAAIGETYSRVHSRKMDDCFENDDGRAVVWELMRRAAGDPGLLRAIQVMNGNDHAMQHWRDVAAYRGPQLSLDL